MILSFVDVFGARKVCQLSSDFSLAEFKSTVENFFGPVENFRFMINGRELTVNDAEKFKAERILIKDNCVIYVLKRLRGGDSSNH